MEERVGFLFKAASTIQQNTMPHLLLKSFYLMRCRDTTNGYGLPNRQFANEKRCAYCFLDWRIGHFETKIIALKLSKNKRRKLKKSSDKTNGRNFIQTTNNLERRHQLERKCLFCNKTTIIELTKPESIRSKKESCTRATQKLHEINMRESSNTQTHIEPDPTKKSKKKKKGNKSQDLPTTKKLCKVDVYAQSKDVFSLHNKNNTISSDEKACKVIKNNKRKKDKFAGLCKQAVLASAKLKEAKTNTNKLNLFLKPSV